ncbi:conserved protein of unknown function [Limnospira indica PCC 8005]|uniref:Uncharacterized protein n=1 Tax=Limnospira indica PCC 8005 TaxID=376219 RepID=A0A9P1KGH2_9CYAN|nr:conserved protein of unknown function [Limnospira indica PCC 8005]
MRRASLPLPVTLKRLAADLRVLSLGMKWLEFDTSYNYSICWDS